ncbi:MerR family transcriptional regulator [Microbacterium sp.]|uniref:MerR family transcriptional regulator n=1 Tax=Microbacterium sp. TaxID=51671 RepID=UPI003F988682
MSWSTSELAGIAGTTVKTIRYYHHIGVLPEPARASNGYKQYQVAHLVTLLRVLRLKELGLSAQSLHRIAGSDDAGWEALKALDAELEERINRWSAVREELAGLLNAPRRGRPPVDLPAGMLGLSASVNDADRALLLVYSRLFDDETMVEVATSLRDHTKTPSELAFDSLSTDADESTKRQLAEDLAAVYSSASTSTTAGVLPVPRITQDSGTAKEVLGSALAEVYNRAQLDVLERVSVLCAPTTVHPADP